MIEFFCMILSNVSFFFDLDELYILYVVTGQERYNGRLRPRSAFVRKLISSCWYLWVSLGGDMI